MSHKKRQATVLKLQDESHPKQSKKDIAVTFFDIASNANKQLENLKYPSSFQYIYNPTQYAHLNYKQFVAKYCNSAKKVMFLGMNPGPWGMSQTGVPFGEVSIVKDWLKIEEPISKPIREHPERPVLGFSCTRSEVSGKRFWGLIRDLCGQPENFFRDCFVYNYLPLQFIDAKGKNLPPTTLKGPQQLKVFEICDKALLEVIRLYEVETVVAIGQFVEARVNAALAGLDAEGKLSVKVVCILHPSPQSKAANNWAADARKQLEQLGLIRYLVRK